MKQNNQTRRVATTPDVHKSAIRGSTSWQEGAPFEEEDSILQHEEEQRTKLELSDWEADKAWQPSHIYFEEEDYTPRRNRVYEDEEDEYDSLLEDWEYEDKEHKNSSIFDTQDH